ncbi:hypothetical protein EV193_101357 [Herbihabitans rhizosphaerae]|uniref:Uncharacterized protein n=1 Tax=Herbihabitans rhizosphaerae TaxID=1872711 RepID=A0A4Q7L775_9PSEU|nr:hypothetical protein [Herbihabitans rhizosphaerae]RZS44481.1 hypothetical protein EV193_101357 [Herbihabitans rhizosphaerae]
MLARFLERMRPRDYDEVFFHRSTTLRHEYWAGFVLPALTVIYTIVGLWKYGSLTWLLTWLCAPIAIYANYRVRTVIDYFQAFVWLLTLLLATVGGLALLAVPLSKID